MYKVIALYSVDITNDDKQVIVSSSPYDCKVVGAPSEVLDWVDNSDYHPEGTVEIRFLNGYNDNNFILEIAKYYKFNEGVVYLNMTPPLLDDDGLEQDFKDLCEDTLTKLKLGCACLVVNDTKLTYELIKTLIEDF